MGLLLRRRGLRSFRSWIVVVVVLGAVLGGALLVRRTWFRAPDPIYVAVALPLSGPQASEGQSCLRAVQLHVQGVNRAGGIDGRQLELLVFDDEGRPAVARERAGEIAAGPAVAVIGHMVSSTSEAAGPVYRDGRLAVVAGTANADQLTKDNPNYFRVIFDTTAEGHNLAIYTRRVLHVRTAGIIATDESYGNAVVPAFTQTFTEEGGTVTNHWVYDRRIDRREGVLDRIADDLKAGPAPEVVLLLVTPSTSARDIVVQLRNRGASPRYLGGTNLGAGAFSGLFADFDNEVRQPGYYTDGINAVAPLLFDSAGARAQEFAAEFERAYRTAPDSRAGKFYDAAQVVVAALRQAELTGTPESRERDRQQVRDQLAALDAPEKAIPGVSGPLFFDERDSQPIPVRIGQYLRGQFISAPQQLTTVSNPALVDLDREIAAGNMFRLGAQYVWLQRVVYTGIDVNQISRLDQIRSSFTTDFYLWFRYLGSDDVTLVEFPTAVDRGFDAQKPLASRKAEDGTQYRLYRVRGEFKNTFDYHDYPFDQQTLVLRFENPRVTREQVVYVADTFGLRLPRPSGSGEEAFKPLAHWWYRGTTYYQDTLMSRSTRGDPKALTTTTETEFSGFNAVARLQRRTTSFLMKLLLPLVMLVLVVYVSLYFPVSLTKERLTISISALLASAVLLTGINTSQLSEANYTTAIEYGFYVFFGLCLFCILTTLCLERLRAVKWDALATRLEVFSRVTYPIVLLGTIATYIYHYGFMTA